MYNENMDDPYNLKRFMDAQNRVYSDVVKELRVGSKIGHWMWFVFPQIAGLGMSATSQLYAITCPEEAQAYLDHPILGERLTVCATLVLTVEGRSALEIFGFPDNLKLNSCMTLFASLPNAPSVFERVINKYFNGEKDSKTLEILASM